MLWLTQISQISGKRESNTYFDDSNSLSPKKETGQQFIFKEEPQDIDLLDFALLF